MNTKRNITLGERTGRFLALFFLWVLIVILFSPPMWASFIAGMASALIAIA